MSPLAVVIVWPVSGAEVLGEPLIEEVVLVRQLADLNGSAA